jgi:phage shock protein C
MYRLRKVTGKEKRIFGVCAGISKYINPEMDPVAIRILWLILTVFAVPPMIILYLALAIVLKPEDYELKKSEKEPEKETE